MKLNELIAGHHGVKIRDGSLYIVVHSSYSEDNFLLGASSYTGLDNYRGDFTHHDHSDIDIVQVFTLRGGPCLSSEFGKCVVWEETSKQGLESQLRALNENLSARETRINEVKEKISLVEKQLAVTTK